MPRRLAEVGEGHEDGNGVYGIIRDLIVEGKDARFVNKKGRFVVNWSRALDCFTDYKAKKNPQFKSKAVSRRKISNGFRSALLNYYKKEGAKEYKDAKKVNENDEVVERQFQMPPRLFKSMFRDVGPTVTEDSEEDDQEDTSSLVSSEGDDKPEVSRSTSTSDTGFDEFMDMSSHEIVEPLENSLAVAGNFLTDLGLDVIKTEGEETSVGLSDVQLPPASEMFDPSMLDSAIEEICSDGISDDISDEGIDLFGVVQDICPTSGSVKGGFQFYISLTEELPDEVKTGVAQFERVANAMVYKLNPFTLTGTVPSSQVPGEVAVTVVTDAGKKLGMTCFRYIDEMREMVRQIVKDPTLQSLWFAMWSQEHGFFGNDSNIAQVLGPIDLQGQDSSVQTKQQQSVKVLQLLVYTAAQTDAREFIEMVFSTSAGQIVFNSYKDRTPLPEDVAQANGHKELAQYLTDINTRLSKETFEDVQSCAIDWLELVKAVQKQSSLDESTKGLQQPSDIDDTSDYFADVETSSCGSSDHDIVWTNMSENKAAWKCPRGSPILQESCTDEDIFNDVHPVGTTMSENGPSNKCPLKATNSDETLKKAEESTQRPTTRPVVDKKGTPSKHEAQLDNENDKEGVSCGSFAHTFDCISRWWRKKDSGPIARAQDNCLDEKEEELPSKSRSLFQGLFWRGSDTSEANVHGASGPHMTKPKECHKRPGRATGISTRKKEAGLNYKGVVLTFALLTVLAGFKLKEGQILHWAVGNGYTQFSKMLLQCGVYVDVPGLLKETPLHLAAKNGFRDLVDVLVQSGGNVNARNFPMQETPLHLATRNGHRFIAQFLVQQGSQVNARNVPSRETPLHLASRNGHRHIAQFLVQQGSHVNTRNVPWQETPLHLASRNGHRHIAQFLVQQGSQVNARNVPWQETPLHLATRNGHRHIVQFLVQKGSQVNARNVPSRETPLHLASRNGHQQIAEFLIHHGSQVNARNVPWQETPLHWALKNGHCQIVKFLKQHGGLGCTLAALTRPSRNGHQQIEFLILHRGFFVAANISWQETPFAELLMQHGAQFNSNIPVQETPLHQGTQNGRQQIAESLVRQEGSANNSNVPLQETSLHGAEKNGHQPAVEFLILKRSQDDARILPMRETPPHLVSQNGCQAIQIAVPLCHNGGQVHARKVETPFHWARKSGPRHTSQFFTQPNDISSRRNDNDLPSQLVARNGQHRGMANAKNCSLQTNFLNLASRTGRRQIAESSIRRGIEIIAKDIQRQETSFIQQGSGINARVCEKDVSLHWAARNEIKRCRQKSSRELVVRRLSQVSVSSVLCHWVKKYSATSDFRPSARRKIPRLRFTRGGGLCNCLNEIDQTKSPIFTERHQHASLGAKGLVDESLVQSEMSTRKEKLLTHAFGSSSNRKTSQELSWYTTALCVDGKCGKDGVNWVLTNNFSVIIGCCVALCFVFVALSLWFLWRNKQTVYFARHFSILPFLDYTSESEVKCIRIIELIESKEGDKCVKEAADNGLLEDKGCTQTISTKNSASELFERKFFPEVETFGYQQLDKDKSVRRLRMERVRKWLEYNHDQDVLSSVENEVEPTPTMSRLSSSTVVKERKEIDETVNIEMPESADTVAAMAQSHAVLSSVQGTYTAVSCIPCGHGWFSSHGTNYRCQKCTSCGNKDVLVNSSIYRDAVCSKSYKSKAHYFNESDGQCYPYTECCRKDKANIEPVPLKRKEKDSGAPAGKIVMVFKSCDVTKRTNSVFIPNTIEMTQMKKKEKGQFVTNVQISSMMSQKDIREPLISLVPYLGEQRDRNGRQKLPQTCSKQKSPERRRRPPICRDPKPVIKDTEAAAASSRQPTGRPGFQVPKEYIRAREGVGNRIPGKQAAPVSVQASKPCHPVSKSHVRPSSAKRSLDLTNNLHTMEVPNEPFSKSFKKVSLSEKDIMENSETVNNFIQEILAAVRKTDAKSHPEWAKFALSESTYATGSYYERLKVCRPGEFDGMVVFDVHRIKRFFDLRCPSKPRDTLGYASVELKTWVIGGRRLWGEFLTIDGKYLSSRKVVSHFYSLVRESVAAMDKKQNQRISNLKEPKGPAVTFTIDGKIDVDLVLSLEISGWPICAVSWAVNFAQCRAWPTLEKVGQITQNGFHLVAKPCFAEEKEPANSQKFWRISFSEAEKTLLYKASLGCEKRYFRIAKAIFEGNKDHLKPLTSYYLKTLFLDLRSQNPRAINKENLGINVVRFFQSLIARLKGGQLPHFFVRDVDLLSRIKKEQRSGCIIGGLC